MARRLKFLFVGLGSIGQRHVRNLRATLGDGVDILAYRCRGQSPLLSPEMNPQSGADLETTYAIRSFSNLETALSEKPDAVFVTNPNTFHLPIAMAAARAGCHLFIEKPLSHTLDGTDELVEITESKRLVAFVGYQFRFHPGLLLVKSLIDTGQLGRLVAAHIVNAEYLPDWHPYEDYRETHPARCDLGGGCLRIQSHEFDYAQWLFGMPKRLYAVGGHLSQLELDVEDSVSILLHCDYQGKPLPVHIHLDYLQRPPQRFCEVIGDEGKVHFDYYANQAKVYDTSTGKTEVHCFRDFERNEMFMNELRHFLACMRGEAKPLINLREAIRSMRIGLAADHSLQSEHAVECDAE